MWARALAVTLAATLALGWARPARSASNCPANQMNVYDEAGVVSSDLPADSRFGSLCFVRYDIPAGTLRGSAGSTYDTWGTASLLVQDEFRVVGLAAGIPVALVAHFKGTGATAQVEIRDAFGHAASGTFEPIVFPELDLTLDLPVVTGQPFIVQYSVSVAGSASGGDSASMTFSFAGVPAGAAVVSCNGYVSDRTVPARRATWGSLKQRYR